MKTVLVALSIFLLLLTTQSFRCDRGAYTQCAAFKQDSVLLNASITNPAQEYHLYDTIWFSSSVNDTYSPLSGSPASFTRPTDLLYLTIQPYSIITTGNLPVLQFANAEFNPVVREGLLQNPGYSGYIYQYRRLAPNNTLLAGIVPGRAGLYLVELNNGTFSYGGFTINNPGEPCATYFGLTNLPQGQQNLGYWGPLGVSALSLPINNGSHTVAMTMRNYLIFKVIP